MDKKQARLGPNSAEPGELDRLDSWKEIAAYLKRDVRTLHRWEDEEGLPVHRHLHNKRGSVYAYRSELEAWWQERRMRLEPTQGAPAVAARPRWALAAAASLLSVIAVLGVAYLAWKWLGPETKAPAGRVTVAVLPFQNLSADPEEQFFADGFTEEMITQLGRLHPESLGTIARTSVMNFRDKNRDLAKIGSELGVGYVLEGSVLRAAGRVRVTAQLVRVKDQTNLWTDSFERELRDVLDVQRDVTEAIARQVQIKLTPQQSARLVRARPLNPEAHEAYLKGLFLWNKITVESLHKSVDFYQAAIEKDPNYAEAYSALAATYGIMANLGLMPSQEALPKAMQAVRKALAIDESLSHAHGQLGFFLMFHDRDWPGAEREFKRAIELNPSNANAHDGYAFYFSALGHPEEALAEIRRARDLDPLSLLINGDLGFTLYFARQYDEALEVLKRNLEMDPNFPPTHWVLALVYEAKGMFREANEHYLKAQSLAQRRPEWIAPLEQAYAKGGWVGRERKRVELITQAQKRGEFVPAYWNADAYAHLHEKDLAIQWLERAADERFYLVVLLKVDPKFDSLRTESRFQALLRRLGLEP